MGGMGYASKEEQNPDDIDLLMLRNRLKRDPTSYYTEFKQQVEHFMALLQTFELQCDSGVLQGKIEEGEDDNSVSNRQKEKKMKHFAELVSFVSHCLPQYEEEKELRLTFPPKVLHLLENRYDYLSPYFRKVLVQSSIMLRNRKVMQTMEMLPVFLNLFHCPDKPLRELLFSHIVNDIAKGPSAGRSNSERSAVQNHFFQTLSSRDTDSVIARKCVAIIIELYRRKVWTDSRTTNVLADACFHNDTQIAVSALRFFLCVFDKPEDGSESKFEQANALRLKASQNHSGKTRKRKRQKEKDIERANKLQQEFEDDSEDEMTTINGDPFGPISDLYDPQKFAERLLSSVRTSKQKFELRLVYMNVLSRTISRHRLIVPNYYPFLQKYIRPHQRFVTQVLSYCIQATHKYLPSEIIRPVLLTLCKEFVSDRSGPEAMSVGLNSIRELCQRQSEMMDEDLLRDLVLYKNHKDKGVMMAGRSLLGAFREINPKMLAKKDRGREASLKDESDESEEEEEEEAGSDSSRDEFVDPEQLESSSKRRKVENEEIRDKAKEKQFFGARTPGGGTSNEEKKRLKPFNLVKYSRRVRQKVLQSQVVKTKRKADHVETMKSRNKHKRRRRRH